MRTAKKVRKWMAWWRLRSEEQLNLRFQGDFSPWLFLPIYYPKETFPGSVQKSGGSCPSTHCSMTSQRFQSSPLLPNGPPTNMKANLRKFLSWSKKLFESFFSVLLRKSPVCSEVGSAQSALMSQLISGSVSKSYQFFAFLIGNVTASLFVYTLYPHRPGY